MEPHLPTKPTVFFSTRCTLLIIWTRINLFFTGRESDDGKKQTGRRTPVQGVLLTEHILKKAEGIVIFLTIVLSISTG